MDPQARGINKVLFIDDNAQIRCQVEEIGRASRASLLVKTASNVEDGVLLAWQFLPDVIFLDYLFAEDRLQGDQALAFIRKAKAIRKVKVVGVANDPEIGEKMLEAGADGFLRKPFGLADFKASVREQTARAERK